MQIFAAEIHDGIAEKICASASVSYASLAEPCEVSKSNKLKNKTIASLHDNDLYYVQSILVSSAWNKNDDIFHKTEVWNARNTPEDKPTNLEHNENLIIGHITSNWPIDDDGSPINNIIDINDLPNKFHILTGSVIYRDFSNPDLKARAENLINEIESGKKYVSMECYFKGFDYGLINKETAEYKILARNEDTAYLTKYLRAYGGQGEHSNYKIGRVLRDITFSGKGFVDKPANPDSIIFTRDVVNKLLEQKNDDLSNSGVLVNEPQLNAENTTMSAAVETNTDLNVPEAHALASDTSLSNETLEAAMKNKDAELVKKEEEMKKMKAEFDEALTATKNEVEITVAELQTALTDKQTELDTVKAELNTANEAIAAYKDKQAEMMKKEKMMKRKAALVEAGLDEESVASTLEKFENIDDTAFETMTSLFAGMKVKKAEMMMETPKKKPAKAEDVVDALEEVETTETVELGVGGEAESTASNTRAELVEFVCARLGKNLNKGE